MSSFWGSMSSSDDMSLTAPLMSPLSFLDDLSSDLEFLRVLFLFGE